MAVASLMILAGVSVVTSTSVRPLCPRGHHLQSKQSREEELCTPCPEGWYMDEPNRSKSCKTRRKCKSSERLIDNGDATRNRICTCVEGERLYYTYNEEYGYDCRSCRRGLVPRPVLNRNGTGDVGCCKEHQVARRDNLGQLSCLDTADHVVPNRASGNNFTACNATLSPKEAAHVLWPYALGFCAIGLLCGGVPTVIVMVVIRRRRNSGYSPASNSMDTPNT